MIIDRSGIGQLPGLPMYNNVDSERFYMKRLLIIFAASLVLITGYSHAFNTLFLEDAPIARFSEEDTRIMMDTFISAMDNNDDGVVSEWMNDETGVSGSVKPLKTAQEIDRICRTVEFKTTAESESETTTFKFCKNTAGEWHIATPES